MKIQILTDNPDSWIIPYITKLIELLKKIGYNVSHKFQHEEIESGDILILLSCEKKCTRLDLNKFNLVVHESALPKGKGWSPLTWQILEGENEIPITLFEATTKIDAGDIYGQEIIKLKGAELVDELREKQAEATIKLLLKFIENYPNNPVKKQKGIESVYPRRKPEDSQIDINKTITEQFNLLRVCDNERYPAFFYYNGRKIILKIYRSDD